MCLAATPPRSSHRHRAYSPSHRQLLISEWRRRVAFALPGRHAWVREKTSRVAAQTIAWPHRWRWIWVALPQPATWHRISLVEAAAGAAQPAEQTEEMVSSPFPGPCRQSLSHQSSVPKRQTAEAATGRFHLPPPSALRLDWAALAPRTGCNPPRSQYCPVYPATAFARAMSPT